MSYWLMLLLSGSHEDVGQEHDERHEDAYHLCGIILGLNPKLLEEIESSEHLDGHPKHDDRSDGHTDIGSPRGNLELLLKNEEAAEPKTRQIP